MNTQSLKGQTAIIYARASKMEQSTKVQVQQLEKFCNENGITIARKPFEENISGAAEHREQLEIILNSEPMADLLVIREVSRLSREEDYRESFNKLVQLTNKYSIYVLLDDTFIEKGKVDLANDIMLMIKLFGAADERKKIRDRTSTAIRKYKEASILNVYCGKQGYGLIKVPNPNFIKGVNTKQIWQINPAEWDNVLKCYELRSKGYSIEKITQITGLNNPVVRQVFDSKIVRYFMETEHNELFRKSEESKESLKTVKSPTKHTNKYKGIIFFQDTHFAMTHQHSSRGYRYKLRNGNPVVKDEIVDDCVERTIRCMLAFFGLKKEELSKDNTERLAEIRDMKQGYINTNSNIKTQITALNKKFIKAPDEEAEIFITEEINRLKEQMESNTMQIRNLESEEARLESIDYTNVKLNINRTNLPDFINKYIRKIEVWNGEGFKVIIKVFVKPEYISTNWYDYKQYEIFNHRGYKIKPIHIEDEVQAVYDYDAVGDDRLDEMGGGNFWSLKVYALPYYQEGFFTGSANVQINSVQMKKLQKKVGE